MSNQPLDLDQIEARVAEHRAALSGWLNCYSPLPEQEALEGAEGVLKEDVPELANEVRRLRDALEEMTRLRDNALRALHRDDVDTDIDLEETIAAPFYGPGWDWDEADLQPVVREAAAAVRPAFGKLTQQLAAVTALCDEQEMAARLFELPTPEWIVAVRRTIEDVAVSAAARP